MQVITAIDKMRSYVEEAKSRGKKIGLVPTMGCFHQGHLSLIEKAGTSTDTTIVSIFVNPAQFGPDEDYLAYPRDVEQDRLKAARAGVDVIFAPGLSEMYPESYLTYVNVEMITGVLCGKARPGHFKGVATVCAKLFNIIKPDIAFFGQKDAQQTIVVKRMVKDLNMDVEIEVLPIVREKDGLAMSSRNKYLNTVQRKDALVLYQALTKAKDMIKSGERNAGMIIGCTKQIMDKAGLKIDYISIVNARQLNSLEVISGEVLIALAVWVGRARLIDNIIVNTEVNTMGHEL
ncbi:MAG: pantoate--beta-alanine ligase [Candidatus Omnitrophota bacterium]|nr:pantoate--beta-alanine ligase [Candidatus Omnitrophota bacterium]